MAKKIGIFFLALVILLLLTVAALPLWIPLVVKPLLDRQGVEYDRYERIGYGRFALRDVEYETEGLRVQADRVEGFGPTAWVWHRWRGNRDLEYAEVEDWRVEILDVEDEPEPDESDEGASVHDVFARIEEQLPRIIAWAPKARLGAGEVIWRDRVVEVRSATWNEGIIAAEVFDRPLQQVVHVEGDLSGGLPFTFRGRTHPFPFALEVTVARTQEGLAVRSQGDLAGNFLLADADFPREGHWPDRAIFRSDQFRLPSEYLRLDGYREVVGDVRLEWQEGRFTLDVNGEAEPEQTDDGVFPPLRVVALARGDLEAVSVEALEISSPWLVANLSAPVWLNYEGDLLSEESTFSLAADLAQQPFLEATGLIRGEATIAPGEGQVPVVDFRLEGEEVAGFDAELSRLLLNGTLRWPRLSVTELDVAEANGSVLRAMAEVDFDRRIVEEGQAAGTILAESVREWLPEESGFAGVDLEVRFRGGFDDLEHEGRVGAEQAFFEGSHRFEGNLAWNGRMASVERFALELLAGPGRLAVEGGGALEEETLGLVLRDLRLEREGETILEARRESRLVAQWDDDGPLLVTLDGMHWVAEEGEMIASAAIAWPQHGEFSVRMRGLGPELLYDFLDVSPGAFDLRYIESEGRWSDSPIDFRILGDMSINLQDEEIVLEVVAAGEGNELRVDRLRASSRGEPLAVAEGLLPISFRPGAEEIVAVRYFGDIDFRIRTEPQAAFWQLLADLTQIHLEDPNLAMELRGTPFEPIGYIRGEASLVHLAALQSEEREIPILQNLQIEGSFDVDAVRLDQAALQVEGQTVQVAAELGMGQRRWQRLVRDRELPDWQQAAGRIRVPEAELAAFQRFVPTLLSPQGIVDADVRISPGMQFGGSVIVEDVATRPLLPLGSVQEGTIRVELDGRTAHVREISGLVGGERLLVSGRVDLPIEQELAFDVKMQGKNLPLARRPGLVVRADLDLNIRGEPEAAPVISGQVNLRDSFYLAQLRLMPAGAVASPERRPPFFSITEEPFSQWQLNVDLRGAEFLTVRGPVFRGTLSANFNLGGTLEEPRAIGSVMIDEGQIRFPFASMHVEQGEIMLPRENPFQPQLFIIAASTTFGYDLRMELSGTAETPVIEFTSNPPLTSEQALLMVTTGDLPRDELTFTTQQRASRFAVYIGQNLLYEITGDDAAADRLTIRSGEQISDEGRETFAIEYRLSKRWSVVGEYDRFDEYNAGLKWNIYSR